MNKKTLARCNAFSLLELMIVITIIGILMAIGLPAYTHHIIRSHRRQAQLALVRLASRLEQYHHLNGTYKDTSLETLHLPQYTQNNAYRIKIISANEHSFKIIAIPQGKQIRDKICQTLGLDEINKQTISGNGNINECWH